MNRSLTAECALTNAAEGNEVERGTNYFHMGTAIKHPVPVICNFWHPGTSTLSPERQSARMSKITNAGRLNPVWHRMLYSCTPMATVGFKGLKIMDVTEQWTWRE